jgi:serine/threonine protein phosphatase PrpC
VPESFPVVEAVKVSGAGATHEGPTLRRNEDAFSFLTDDSAALAVVAGAMGRHSLSPRTAGEVTIETCKRIFRGRSTSILDDLAETWWRAEHGGDSRPSAGGPRPRPYATLPIADRAELRDRVMLLLERRIPDSMGDVAVLEAEKQTLLALPVRSLERANRELHRAVEKDPHHRPFSTSAACAIFAAGQVSIGHAGSCRVYRVRGTKIEAVTREHYLVNEYDTLPERTRQQMTREEVATAYPNIVTRALGLDESIKVDASVVPAEHGDVFVLTTDGFWKAIPPEAIRDAVRADARTAADALMNRAKVGRPDHPGDNLTVVIVAVL